MSNTYKRVSESTRRLVLVSVLGAMVTVLAYFGGFIKIGGLASISLTLIPVVLGASLCGPWAGAILGGISGVVFFATADAVFWFGLSIAGTIITVMLKAILAGLAAGFVYKLLEKKNRLLAVVTAAVVCPVVNTSVFLLGCSIFFMDTVRAWALAAGSGVFAYLIVVFVGLNFVFELVANVVFSPAIVKLIDLRNRK